MPISRPRSGFSLVELLVVISVVVLLVALLLPALSRARYVAKETMCGTQLRQVVIAVTTYAADENGWYPKRGAYRNNAYSLKNGVNWDLHLALGSYISDFDLFHCPLLEDDQVSNTTTSSAYALLFNTYATPTTTGSIGSHAVSGSTPRLVQYDINGNMIADGSSWSAAQTWYYPRVEESQLMRTIDDTWTASNSGLEYNLLAMDRLNGRGHPLRSRESNHPEPGEAWNKGSSYWTGPSGWMPRTSANYAASDGSVYRRTFEGTIYYHGPQPTEVRTVNNVGMVPDRFIVR